MRVGDGVRGRWWGGVGWVEAAEGGGWVEITAVKMAVR